MKLRALGTTGLLLSEIGLGCSELGRPLVHRDSADWIRFLHRSFDLGVNFYDTGSTYRYGISERLLGRAFRNRRDSVVVCTKAGYISPPASALLEALPAPLQRLRRLLNERRRTKAGHGTLPQDFSPEALSRSVEGSLRRLGTDRIDVLLLHNPPLDVLARTQTLEAVERLIEAGKVRFWGVSADSMEVARRCLELPRLSVVQLDYSILQPEAKQVIRLASEKGVGVVARLVLARGLLTGRQALSTGARTLGTHAPAMLAGRTAEIVQMAREAGRSVTESAILFALAGPEVSCALVGTTQPSHLEEAVAALAAQPLTDAELGRLVG